MGNKKIVIIFWVAVAIYLLLDTIALEMGMLTYFEDGTYEFSNIGLTLLDQLVIFAMFVFVIWMSVRLFSTPYKKPSITSDSTAS